MARPPTITLALLALSCIAMACDSSTSDGGGATSPRTNMPTKRDGGTGGEAEEPGGW